MSDEQIRASLVKAGVKNLKTFGYPGVTEENIFTDYIYRGFFKGMLEDEENVGVSRAGERVRLKLLEEVNALHAAANSGESA